MCFSKQALFYFFLEYRLELFSFSRNESYSPPSYWHANLDFKTDEDSNNALELMWNKVKNRKSISLDYSGDFRLISLLADKRTPQSLYLSPDDVTLVTQASLSQLHHLDFLIRRWKGSLSIAIFAELNEVPLSLEIVFHLQRCHSYIFEFVTFHLVHPVGEVEHEAQTIKYECQNIPNILQDLKKKRQNYNNSKVLYPINLLRNVARNYSGTDFTLVVDIDMLPNSGLFKDWRNFMSRTAKSVLKKQIAFVIPTYEVKQDLLEEDVPQNKRELMQLISVQEARPFYSEVCWKCHKWTNYSLWESIGQEEHLLTTVYSVEWKDPWEPFFISNKSLTPVYDERFRSYGFNRISHVCESFVSGFSFLVLNHAFLLHRGFKTLDSFHSNKDLDQERNRVFFREFKTSFLQNKYPDSTRKC